MNSRVSRIQSLLKEKLEPTPSKRPQFWKPAKLIRRITSNPTAQQWLNTQSSLTAKLKQSFPTLAVKVLFEGMETPLASEAECLGMYRNEAAWIRCVVLQANNKNLVYARTIIPHFTPENPWHEIQTLGTKPLGELLFEMPNLERLPFEFATIALNQWPYLPAGEISGKTSFSRRSVFLQNQAPLLLTEAFLPDLIHP